MELLVGIAAFVAFLWGCWFLTRGSLVAGCLLFLLATCCFGYPFLQLEAGPISVTLDRLFIVFLAGMYVVQRGLRRADPKPLDTVDKLWLLFFGVLALSTFTHNWRNLPPGSVSPVWHLTTGYLIPLIVYWIAPERR